MKRNILILKGFLKKAAIPVILSLTVCLSGCGAAHTAGEEADNEVQEMEDAFPEVPEEPGEPGYPIPTILGELEFPAEWAGCIRVADESTDEVNSVSVYGTAEEKEALLFTINLGAGNEGFLFGSVPDAQGEMIEVRIDIEDFTGDESWSDTAVEQIVTMQSRVNDVIEQIYALPGFVRAE